MKNIKLNTSRKSGFSLAELFIVLTIIGIIAAIAIPLYYAADKDDNSLTSSELEKTNGATAGPQLPSNTEVLPAQLAGYFVDGYAALIEKKIIVGRHEGLTDMITVMHNNLDKGQPHIDKALYGVLKAKTLDETLLQKNGVYIDNTTGLPIMKKDSKTTALPIVPTTNPAS